MIRGVLFAVCAAALMGCAMESGEDETTTAVDTSADPATMMNMDRGYIRPSLSVTDNDRCGSPRHRVEDPSALPTNLTHVPTPVQMTTTTR